MSKESKFSTDVLSNIIHKYYTDGNYIGKKLSFSELARYAKEKLGYTDIQYYHFSRDKEINDKIKEYNNALDSSSIQYYGEENSFVKLNVKEFVKIYSGDREKLTFYLNNLQESQKKLFDNKIELELKIKQLEEENKGLKKQRDSYKEKNKELITKVETLKKQVDILTTTLGYEEEKQLITALNSTGLHFVEFEGEAKTKEDIENLDDDNGKDLKSFLGKYTDIFGNK